MHFNSGVFAHFHPRSYIQVPFLNLMSNIVQRAGAVHVRTGGNTQDYAFYVDQIPNSYGMCIGKMKEYSNNPVSIT